MPKFIPKPRMTLFSQITPKSWLLCGVLLISVAAAGACSKDKATLSSDWAARNGMPVLEMQLKGLDIKSNDINSDGIDDQMLYYRDEQLVYAVRDIDFDGIIDLHEYYENGAHVRDEIDIDYDGHCDLIVLYKGGKVEKRYYSVDFQATRQGIQIFDADGKRIEVQRDTTGDGFLDTIEYFQPGAKIPYQTQKYREGEKKPYSTEESKEEVGTEGEPVLGPETVPDAKQPVLELDKAKSAKAEAQNSAVAPQAKAAEGME